MFFASHSWLFTERFPLLFFFESKKREELKKKKNEQKDKKNISKNGKITLFKGIRSLVFKTLNQQRYQILIEQYISQLPNNETPNVSQNQITPNNSQNRIQTPKELQNEWKEYIIGFKKEKIKIIFGCEITQIFEFENEIFELKEIFKNENFILDFKKEKIFILLKKDISSFDLLKSFFFGVYLKKLIEQNEKIELKNEIIFVNQNFENFLGLLKEKEWNIEKLVLGEGQYRFDWST